MPERPPKPICDYEDALRDHALTFPDATEDFPWDHRAFKVRGKVFVFLACDANGVRMSVKLPESNEEALLLPFAEPTGYGLGKHGWVSATFEGDRKPPIPVLRDWIEESYRAVAPKRLVRVLDGEPATPRKKSAKGSAKKSAKKKTAPKAASKKKAPTKKAGKKRS